MKTIIQTGEYKLDDSMSCEFNIDEFIDFLNKQKGKGATHFYLSVYGYDSYINKIETYYERDLTDSEIKEKELAENAYNEYCKANGISRTLKVNYIPHINLNEND